MKLIIKVLYIPFGLVFGFLGRRAGQQLFGVLWRDDVPSAKAPEASVGKVVAAAALQAGAFAAAKAAADRAGARTFRHVIGAWPEQPSAGGEEE
jgi:Protein of unknown function (DUF4235)